ncbi:MAG: cell adhesion protein [Chloroflexi bacterium]|nr:cell adhesion protein [Chloroflexota bacterium]
MVLIILGGGLLLLTAAIIMLVISQWPRPTEPGETLEYGLVWYGRDNASQPAKSGQDNPYYDSAKPTIIFVHGWLPDQAGEPPTFQYTVADEEGNVLLDTNLANDWVEAGWNVGIFYWSPFADEDVVVAAENKIWTADSLTGMRWRSADGKYHVAGAPEVSASALFYEAYKSALADYTGETIRLAGHSLGNQMAVAVTLQILAGIEQGEIAENLRPQRIALLDPYWSLEKKDFLGDVNTGAAVRQAITEQIIPAGILVEWYRSSLLTQGEPVSDANEALRPLTAYTRLIPNFCAVTDQVCRHEAGWQLYFLSYGDPPPPECVRSGPDAPCEATGDDAASASTPDERIAEMMSLPWQWRQVHGRLTPQMDDDWFERVGMEIGD